MPQWSIYLAAVLGAICVLTVCVVYVRHRHVDSGGMVIAAIGLVLFALPVLARAIISIGGPEGVRIEIERVEKELIAVRKNVTDLQERQSEVVETIARSDEQLLAAVASIEAQREAPSAPTLDIDRVSEVLKGRNESLRQFGDFSGSHVLPETLQEAAPASEAPSDGMSADTVEDAVGADRP